MRSDQRDAGWLLAVPSIVVRCERYRQPAANQDGMLVFERKMDLPEPKVARGARAPGAPSSLSDWGVDFYVPEILPPIERLVC